MDPQVDADDVLVVLLVEVWARGDLHQTRARLAQRTVHETTREGAESPVGTEG